MDPELQKNMKLLTKLSILVMALVAIYLLFTYVFPILGQILSYLPIIFLPFILALLLALITEPVVRFFESRLRLSRIWAVVISLILVVGGFIYLVSAIISIIIRELSRLYPQIAHYSDQIVNRVITTISDFQVFYLRLNLPPQVEATIQDNLGKSLQALQALLDASINGLVHILTMLPGALIFLMIATVATFFIMKDRKMLKEFSMRFIPGSAQSKTVKVISELFGALVGFLKAYGILITITAVVTMVSLKILQVEYVLTIGLLVGICDILPVLGPGAIFVPWIIWNFISGNNSLAISLLVIYVVISVVRQFLEPKIVGDNIGLHPLATLISLYAGLQLGGIIGMIMGPVIVVIIMACYRVGLFEGLGWGKKD
jgi:sporulation integral membrane protein YtvI